VIVRLVGEVEEEEEDHSGPVTIRFLMVVAHTSGHIHSSFEIVPRHLCLALYHPPYYFTPLKKIWVYTNNVIVKL
jgi:hypothetical protein